MENCPHKRRATDDNSPACPEAIAAADLAVKKVFAILGVDIDKPESVAEFQADLRFGKGVRKASGYGVLVFVSAVVSGVVYASWLGIAASAKGLR